MEFGDLAFVVLVSTVTVLTNSMFKELSVRSWDPLNV